MWKLALRNVLRHKTRSGMTFLAIVTGIVGLILSGGFISDIYTQLGEVLIHSQSGHLQIAKADYFEHGARSPEKYLIKDPGVISKAVSKIPGVADVMGRLYFSGLLNNGHSDMPIIGEGVDPAREARLGSSMRITQGHQLNIKDAHGAMIGQGLSHALNLNPGDWINLVVNTPDGSLNSLEFQVTGIFQTFSRDYDARAVRIPLSDAQDLLDTSGVNTLVVSLQKTQDTDRLARELAGQSASSGLEVKTWVELNDFYSKVVKMYDVQYGVLRIIILLMVLLSVVNSVNMSVFERVGEFGTMMALGNRRRRVFELIVLENTIIGLAGAICGVLLGICLALLISAIGIPMPPPPNSDLPYIAHISIIRSVVFSAFMVGFFATVVASFLPAMRVYKVPVVDALRENV